jgi:hypothetical protein
MVGWTSWTSWISWTSCNPGLAGRSSAKNSPWSSPRFPSRRGWAHVFTRLSACLSRMQKGREKKTLPSAGCAGRAGLSPASGRPINPGIARPASRLSGSMIWLDDLAVWSAPACPRWPRDLRVRNRTPRGAHLNTRGLYEVVYAQAAPSITPAKEPPNQAFARICPCFSDCFSGGLTPRRMVLPLTNCHLGYSELGMKGSSCTVLRDRRCIGPRPPFEPVLPS